MSSSRCRLSRSSTQLPIQRHEPVHCLQKFHSLVSLLQAICDRLQVPSDPRTCCRCVSPLRLQSVSQCQQDWHVVSWESSRNELQSAPRFPEHSAAFHKVMDSNRSHPVIQKCVRPDSGNIVVIEVLSVFRSKFSISCPANFCSPQWNSPTKGSSTCSLAPFSPMPEFRSSPRIGVLRCFASAMFF